jgi:hypothetical protein
MFVVWLFVWQVFDACDANLVLIVMVRCVGGKYVLSLCLPPSEVKLWCAPSEVHYFQFHLGGQVGYLYFMFSRIRKYLLIASRRSLVRRRPDTMGPPVAGLIRRAWDPLRPELPSREMMEMVRWFFVERFYCFHYSVWSCFRDVNRIASAMF